MTDGTLIIVLCFATFVVNTIGLAIAAKDSGQ